MTEPGPEGITPVVLTTLDENAYLTYTHANPFTRSGRIVFPVTGLGRTAFYAISPDGENKELLFSLEGELHPDGIYPDVALECDRLAFVFDNKLWTAELEKTDSLRVAATVFPDEILHSVCAIEPEGQTCLAGISQGRKRLAVRFELDTGVRHDLVVREDWELGHVQSGLFDPDWVGFCHEGNTLTIPDRVWGWHPQDAPDGRCLFDQRIEGKSERLCVGHERWCFHENSVLAVAYGCSLCEPRGLYEIPVSGRPPRIVSEGNRHWHCNISRDGRLAVVDTTGPYNSTGRDWEDADGISDILLIDMEDDHQTFLARSHMGPLHPAHPHPAFSPDGRYVIYNDCEETSDGIRTMMCSVKLPCSVWDD